MTCLGEEVMVHIMRLIPIQKVFTLMSVSRDWESAARAVVRTHTTLLITSRPAEDQTVSPMDMIIAKGGTDMVSLMKSVNQMANLRKFLYRTDRRSRGVLTLVAQNASTLQVVHTIKHVLPYDAANGPNYPKLRELRCRYLIPDMAAACPQLRHVMIRHQKSVDAMFHLNPERMDFFSARITDWGKEGNVTQMVRALTRLLHLNVLRLDLASLIQKHEDIQPLLRLFDEFTELEEVSIRMTRRGLDMDSAIASLVNRNRRLKVLSLTGMRVTDVSLSVLSELHHLSSIILTSTHTFSQESLISLLRGQSRSELRHCSVRPIRDLDKRTLTQEINSMAEAENRAARIHAGISHLAFDIR